MRRATEVEWKFTTNGAIPGMLTETRPQVGHVVPITSIRRVAVEVKLNDAPRARTSPRRSRR